MLRDRIVEDLRASGLDFEALKKKKLVAQIERKELSKLFSNMTDFDVEGGAAYQYYSLSPKGVTAPTEYYRYKVYWNPLKGFAAKAKDSRPKYLQPVGTPVRLYVPPQIDWTTVVANPAAHSVVVVEGEKKAIALAERGVAAVAVGGVYSFSRQKTELLPELELLAAGGRTIYIVYDIDEGFRTMKPEVAKAAMTLAQALIKSGARPRITTLPSDGKNKCAADDWLLTVPLSSNITLLEALFSYSQELDTSVKLYEEARQYVYINNTKILGHAGTRELVQKEAYLTSRCNIQVEVQELRMVRDKTTGLTSPHRVSTIRDMGDAFLRWPSRPIATGITYEPGTEQTVTLDGLFNQWRGWQQTPAETVTEFDVEPLRSAFKALYGDDWLTMWEWFLLPIARPGVQQTIIPIIRSLAQGVGKSSIPFFFARFVYGEGEGSMNNAVTLNSASVNNDRMEFLLNKQFVFLDDLNEVDKKIVDLLKNLSTSSGVNINQKYVSARSIVSKACLCITTNRTKFANLDLSDRRFFLPQVRENVLPKVWDELHKWGAKGGGSKVIAYAQKLFKHEHISPHRPAPNSLEKDMLLSMAMSEIDVYVRGLTEAARAGKLNRTIAKVSEIRGLLLSAGICDSLKEAASWTVHHALENAGASPYRTGVSKQTWVGGRMEVLYVLADELKWANATPEKMRKEFETKPMLKGPYLATGTKY